MPPRLSRSLDALSDLHIGFSDHTEGSEAAARPSDAVIFESILRSTGASLVPDQRVADFRIREYASAIRTGGIRERGVFPQDPACRGRTLPAHFSGPDDPARSRLGSCARDVARRAWSRSICTRRHVLREEWTHRQRPGDRHPA